MLRSVKTFLRIKGDIKVFGEESLLFSHPASVSSSPAASQSPMASFSTSISSLLA
jgi:hypothetical protein